MWKQYETAFFDLMSEVVSLRKCLHKLLFIILLFETFCTSLLPQMVGNCQHVTHNNVSLYALLPCSVLNEEHALAIFTLDMAKEKCMARFGQIKRMAIELLHPAISQSIHGRTSLSLHQLLQFSQSTEKFGKPWNLWDSDPLGSRFLQPGPPSPAEFKCWHYVLQQPIRTSRTSNVPERPRW